MSAPTTPESDPQIDRWKRDGVRVVPGDRLDSQTAQTPGMDRRAAIGCTHTPSMQQGMRHAE